MKSGLKFITTIILTVIFMSSLSVNAQELNGLQTRRENSIILNGKTFSKYIEFSNQNLAKEYLLNEYYDVINKIMEYNDSDDDFDLDDISFQKLIFSLDIYKTEHEKEFRGLVDIYENYAKNRKMDSLYNQYLNTTDELDKMSILLELDNISAIDTSMVDNNIISSINPFEDTSYSTFGTPVIVPPLDPGTYANGYNRNAARDYTYDWAYKRNNDKYGYYSRYHNCENCWQDCADFVSQILYEGGMKQYYKAYWPIVGNLIKENNDNWYYYDNNGKEAPSNSWGGAANFYKHWSKRTVVTSDPKNVNVMDPVSLDFQGDGDIDHTVIVLNKTYSLVDHIFYAAHTSDRLGDMSIGDAIGSSGKWYAYRMEFAKNNGTFW